MALFRRLFSTFSIDDISIHVFADGSPQYRGHELFAVSFDIIHSGGWQTRKLLPCISLPRWMADALSKVLAMLWQFWLMVGPDYETMRKLCNRVVSFCTDSGVERKLVRLGC